MGTPFRPYNGLKRPTQSKQPQSHLLPKAFDLHQGYSNTIGNDKPDYKRQKLMGPENPSRRTSSNSEHRPKSLYDNLSGGSQSPVQSATVKSAHSLGTRNADPFGGVQEFRNVEALMSGKGLKRMASKDFTNQSSSARGGFYTKPSMFSTRRSADTSDAIVLDDDIEEVTAEPTAFKGSANLKQGRTKLISKLERNYLDDGMSKDTTKPSQQLRMKTAGSEWKARPGPQSNIYIANKKYHTPFDVDYEDEDSMDQLAEGHGHESQRLIAKSTSLGKDTESKAFPVSGSLSRDGDIRPTGLSSKTHSSMIRKRQKSESNQKVCIPLAYIRADEQFWTQKGKGDNEPWHLQLNGEGEFDLYAADDCMSKVQPKLVLRPSSVLKTIFSRDSPKIIIQRSPQASLGIRGQTMLVETQDTKDATDLIQSLEHLSRLIKVVHKEDR
jgi:hypothetical protein